MLLRKYSFKFSKKKYLEYMQERYGLQKFSIGPSNKNPITGEEVYEMYYCGEPCRNLPAHQIRTFIKAVDAFPEDPSLFSSWLFTSHKHFEPLYLKLGNNPPMIELMRTYYPLDWNRVWLQTFRTMVEDVMGVTEPILYMLTGQPWDLSLFSTIFLAVLLLFSFSFTVFMSVRVLLEIISLLRFRKQVLRKLAKSPNCEIVSDRKFLGRRYTLRVTQVAEPIIIQVDGKNLRQRLLIGRVQFIPDHGVRLATTFRQKIVPISKRPRLRKK